MDRLLNSKNRLRTTRLGRLLIIGATAAGAMSLSACLPLKSAPPSAPPTEAPAPAGPTAPAAPTVDLDAASDSGTSSTDNLTNDRTPTLNGTAEPDSTVKVFDGATEVASVTATVGTYTFTPASNLSGGTHTYTATATNANGTSPTSSGLPVVIDFAPPTVNTPDLAAADDSGFSSTDNITNVTTPTLGGFTGGSVGEVNPLVELFDGATSLGTVIASGVSWSITPTSALSDGPHSLTARASDAAGNLGPSSLPLNLTIDTVAAVAISLPTEGQDLTPGGINVVGTCADSFVSGSGQPVINVVVNLYSGATATGTPLASPTGTPQVGGWFTNTPSLGAGTYTVQANYVDYAGNAATSTEVTFTI